MIIISFPNDVTKFVRRLDPQASDLPAIEQYDAKFNAKDLAGANAILEANPRLKQIIINAVFENAILDEIEALEVFCVDTYQEYVAVTLKNKGDWNNTTKYKKFDVVGYVINGAKQFFECLPLNDVDVPIGALPTNSTYFYQLTLQGEQGISGLGLAWAGAFKISIPYSKDTCVTYNNILWASKQASIGQTPNDVSAYWEKAMEIHNQIVISPTQPSIESQNTNDFWYNKKDNEDTYKEMKRNSDGTYTQLYPETKATSLILTKKGTVYNFIGEIPTTGSITAFFDVPTGMAYVEGDTFAINGVPYRALDTLGQPVSGFAEGATVMIGINVDTKLISFNGGGGGSMASFEDHVLVTSGKYDVTGNAFINTVIPKGTQMSTRMDVIGNKAYSCDTGTKTILERDLTTNAYIEHIMSGANSGITYLSVFNYNDELYAFGFFTYTTIIYKVNLINNTYTSYMEYSDRNTLFYSTGYPLITKVNSNKFVAIGMLGATVGSYGAFIFDMQKITFKSISLYATALSSGIGVSQRLDDGNWLFGMVDNSAPTILKVHKYFIASDTMSPFGNMTLPSSAPFIMHSHQFGNKLMYLTNTLFNGKYTGELDLLNLSIDTTKYPNTLTANNYFNSVVYENELIKFNADRKEYLPLISTPPEQNAMVLVIMKGQSFSSLYRTIHIDAIASIGQEAFDITTSEQVATKNLFIHLGQYQTVQDEIVKTWRLK